MPKLSQDSLNKRFACQYCGGTFRTRQGLSGHIQFKHKSKDKAENKSFLEQAAKMVSDSSDFKKHVLSAGYYEEDMQQMQQIFIIWQHIKILFKEEHLTLNNTDYKNYLIVSLALMQANQQLHQELTKNLAGGMATGFTRLAKMITAINKQSQPGDNSTV
jgi:hypothetical protein